MRLGKCTGASAHISRYLGEVYGWCAGGARSSVRVVRGWRAGGARSSVRVVRGWRAGVFDEVYR